jgi:hypothetical protein
MPPLRFRGGGLSTAPLAAMRDGVLTASGVPVAISVVALALLLSSSRPPSATSGAGRALPASALAIAAFCALLLATALQLRGEGHMMVTLSACSLVGGALLSWVTGGGGGGEVSGGGGRRASLRGAASTAALCALLLAVLAPLFVASLLGEGTEAAKRAAASSAMAVAAKLRGRAAATARANALSNAAVTRGDALACALSITARVFAASGVVAAIAVRHLFQEQRRRPAHPRAQLMAAGAAPPPRTSQRRQSPSRSRRFSRPSRARPVRRSPPLRSGSRLPPPSPSVCVRA